MEQSDFDVNMFKRPRPGPYVDDSSIACLMTPAGREFLNRPHESDVSRVPTITIPVSPQQPGLLPRPPPPPIITQSERGMSAMGNAIAQQASRQSSLEVTARNLAVALSTASQRMGTGKGAHRNRLNPHGNVMEPQQSQQENAEQGMSYVVGGEINKMELRSGR